MKSIKKLLLVLFLGIHFCQAQDSTVVLSPGMFDKTFNSIFITPIDGWLFKEGHDTALGKKDIDTKGWKRLNPTEISAKYADKNGMLDCWFRIKIKLDTAFVNKPLHIRISTWAAIDIYLDGILASSYGNTGKNGFPFRESTPRGNLSVPVNLMPGNEYTIAMHFVDQVAALPPHRLQSEDMPLQLVISLIDSSFHSFLLKMIVQKSNYETLWLSVSIILSLLFWLLSILNLNEKNLRLIALSTTFLAMEVLCQSGSIAIGISYFYSTLFSYGVVLFLSLIFITIPLIIARIFKREISFLLKTFLIIVFLAIICGSFLPINTFSILSAGLIFIIISICIYYIFSSWKNLKGPQWAIVAGVLSSLFFFFLYFFMQVMNTGSILLSPYLYVTGFVLAFPLSLLVYVAMRFKEIIVEVQQNAKQVVQLSEEKKEQAINQQKILQEEVNRQTLEIRTTLDNLKAAQHQLIQSEKMASLGELTAGIAHEIQNPLNFVNNFSEVNRELLAEMNEEIDKGNIDEVKEIAKDITENEEKINHHGKRADAIVKGMLQHSRQSSGTKEPTDINALADEYLRLAYHGLRTKDKDFNATLKTEFDESIGKINIIPQDIGKVFLNLYTNAFYAVNEKQKTESLTLNAEGSKLKPESVTYEPRVSITTKKLNDTIEISVTDNGNGIPDKIKDKIFQPFFTTKPTGQGTGLGLSLSYDIIMAHRGQLKVQTKEREGSAFIIQLPAV
jgi:signal transduction histidine kinase